MKYKNKHFKTFEKEKESQFTNYRDEDEEQKENFINEKLSKLHNQPLVKQINLNELLWDFDALSLYSSAMWVEKSNYLRIEIGCAYTTDMKDELVEKFNNGKYNQGSAILKIENYFPKTLIIQHLPFKEREKKLKLIV